MNEFVSHVPYAAIEPVRLSVDPAIFHRNRLTTAFRALLALPHLMLVGGPAAGASLLAWYDGGANGIMWGGGAGLFGAAAGVMTVIVPPDTPRERISVAFRLILAIPHLIGLSLLSVAWAIATLGVWCTILLTGRAPEALCQFSAGALRYSVRVEAYVFLLHDEFPPFSLKQSY
jgi:hypothetical protein